MQASGSEIQKDIVKLLERLGIIVYGFADVGDIAADKFEKTPYAISIGIPLSPVIVDDIIAGPNQVYYNEYLSVNDRLDLITEQLTNAIHKKGYLAYAIPSSKRTDFINIKGEFSHKAAAIRGGLGWIGKSSLLITKRYGPRIRIATVLTEIPFATNEPVEKNYCGTCKKCFEACPAGAIMGNRWSDGVPRDKLIDVKKCDLWKINHYSQFHGHVCGICVAVCPHGKKPAVKSNKE